ARKPGWCPEDNWESKAIGETFLDAASFRFSLLANPTKKIKSATNAKNGRRVPLVKREDLLAWLERKASQHGFRITTPQIRTVPRPRQSFVKASENRAGVHTATEFTGILEVTDPAAFRAAFACGIGSAKAFGFGMLCLAPMS
nr:type I-E CRISPR-associated protein Cas6/Cse3/CasE [Akkermansiaceae bacterium]